MTTADYSMKMLENQHQADLGVVIATAIAINAPKRMCEDCRHYVERAPGSGECRRYPPQGAPPQASNFPLTQDNWWCGEYEHKRRTT